MTDDELHREEWIEERSGILEFDAGYDRTVAEALAADQWHDYSRAQARAGSLS